MPDMLLCRLFCFLDDLRFHVIADPDDPGSGEAEYGGGFSRTRCPEGVITRSERASAALPVGGGVLARCVWWLEGARRKGEIMSAASVTGNVVCPLEEKPEEIGEMSDVGARLVVE